MCIVASVFFSWDFLFWLSKFSTPCRLLCASWGIFYGKFLVDCDMPPTLGGVVHLGGVLPASRGDRLRLVESGFDFSVRLVEHGALCKTRRT